MAQARNRNCPSPRCFGPCSIDNGRLNKTEFVYRTMSSAKISSSELYDHDYYAWIQDQVRALRERRIEDVDWDNVAEEIEDLGKSERRGIRSQMARLGENLLKIQYAR